MSRRVCGTANEVLLPRGLVTVYGPAGSGKTHIALYAVSQFCSKHFTRQLCYYITTEGFHFLHRAEAMGIDLERLIVGEALDLLDLAEDIIVRLSRLLRRLRGFKLVVVDNIAHAYRLMMGERQAYPLLSFLLAYMRLASSSTDSTFLVTAQVHEVEGGVEPVASKPIFFWSNRVVRLERRNGGERVFRVEKPEGFKELVYTIDEEGVSWLKC